MVTAHIISRRGADSFHRLRPEDEKLTDLRVRSLESYLTRSGIEPYQYSAVYEKSLELYNPDHRKAPWGIDYVIDAIKVLKSPPPKKSREAVRKVYICDQCKDTGYELKGLLPVKVEVEGRTINKPCTECSG